MSLIFWRRFQGSICSLAYITMFFFCNSSSICAQTKFSENFGDPTSKLGNISYSGRKDNHKKRIVNGQLEFWHLKHKNEYISIKTGNIDISNNPFLNIQLSNDTNVHVPFYLSVALVTAANDTVRLEKREISLSTSPFLYSFSFLSAFKKLDLNAKQITNILFVVNPRYDFSGTFYLDDILLGDGAIATPCASYFPNYSLFIEEGAREIKIKNIDDGYDGQQMLSIVPKEGDPKIIRILDSKYDPIKKEASIYIKPSKQECGNTFLEIVISATTHVVAKTIRIDINVEANNSPTIIYPQEVDVLVSGVLDIPVDVDDGNKSAVQKILLDTPKNNNLISAVYNPEKQTISLSAGKVEALTYLKFLISDDGGIVCGGINSKEHILKVNIVKNINHTPVAEKVNEQKSVADNLERILVINNVHDGDQGRQNLLFDLAIEDTNLIQIDKNFIYDHDKHTLSIKYTPVKTGFTKAKIKITEAGNLNPKDTMLIIDFNVRPIPKTGLIESFVDGKDALKKWRPEGFHTLRILEGRLQVEIDKPDGYPEKHAGFWYRFDELDIYKNPRVSIKAKIARDILYYPFIIYLFDSKKRYNVQSPIQKIMSWTYSAISPGYEEYYFDFTEHLLHDGNLGSKVNLHEIDSILININPGNPFHNGVEISEIRIGDQAHEDPCYMPRIDIANYKERLVYLTDEVVNFKFPLVSISRGTPLNPGITYDLEPTFSSFVENTRLTKEDEKLNLSFKPKAEGRITFNIVNSAQGCPSNTTSFDVIIKRHKGASSITINTDTTKKYHYMDGFGVSNLGPAFFNIAIDDLGLNIVRMTLDPRFEEVNDNSNPDAADISNFNVSTLQYLPELKQLYAKNKDLKIIASVWSPPAWMKNNLSLTVPGSTPNAISASTEDDNTLRLDCYDEYAEYVTTYIKTIKKETGIELHALSIQNEPDVNKSYSSCRYTPEQYKTLLIIVKKRLIKEKINTKLIGPETIAENTLSEKYRDNILEDSAARQYLSYLGLHSYSSNGMYKPTITGTGWEDIKSKTSGSRKDLRIWITETSGEKPTYNDAFSLAYQIGSAIKYGGVSAYCYWNLYGGDNGMYGLYSTTDQFLKKYYAFKNYSAFIKPGAVLVNSDYSASDLMINSFLNPDGTITMVVVNGGDQKLLLNWNIGLNKVADYKSYRTSMAFDCEIINDTIEKLYIDAESITTFTTILNNSQPKPIDNSVTFAVYPNPARDYLNVTVPENTYDDVQVIDVLGRIVLTGKINLGETKLTFLLKNLPLGTYIVEAIGSNFANRKMIVVH